MEKLSESLEERDVPRNSVDFGKWLEEHGMDYGYLYYYLNGNGISQFNDILTTSGCIEKTSTGKYSGRREYHTCDNGKRTPEEGRLDCEVGNIQEMIFCLDNVDFKPNENATNNTSKRPATAKELDLIHIPTGVQVEFKTCYAKKMYGHNAYYNHRDSHFREFLERGNIMIVYFVILDKIAVISKKNLGKSAKIDKEHYWDETTQKYWDNIKIWDGLMYDYTMMKGGNHAISEKVSKIVKYGETQ